MQEYPIGVFVRVCALMSAFEAAYADDFYFGGENHNFWEAVYVMDGRVGVSGDGRVYELGEGELVFHKPMEFHKIWAVPGARPRVFTMSFFAAGSRMAEFENGVYRLSYLQKQAMEDVISLFRRQAADVSWLEDRKDFLENWRGDSLYSQLAANGVERLLLLILAEQTKGAEPDETGQAKLYRAIVSVLESHIEGWIGVEEVARLCASSVSSVKKVFRKYANHGIHKYFLKMKLIRAVTLLEEGYPVQDISERLGFNNPNYFSMVFKRETGFSPTQYRKTFLLGKQAGERAVLPILLG